MRTHELFYQSAQWVDQNWPEERQRKFHEYLGTVDYHFSSAEQASSACSSSIYRPLQYSLGRDEKSIFLIGSRPEDLVRHGDIAIREAVSAIDTALVLTNHILEAGVSQNKINWSRDGRLRKALKRLPEKRSDALVAAVDSVFGSIGYELLSGYRNWVTHRGAPRVTAPEAVYGREAIMLSDEIFSETNASKKDWSIQTHLMKSMPEQTQVQCWPFVPQVQQVVNQVIENPESDVYLPGSDIPFIRLAGPEAGKGRKIVVEGLRLQFGSLEETAEEFKESNPVLLEGHRAEVAGEDLAVYSATDYVQAVGSVVRFVRGALMGTWDAELRGLLPS